MVAYPSNPLPLSDAKRWKHIQICGNHDALMVNERWLYESQNMQADGVDTNWNGQRVFAMYFRPYETSANSDAEKSIRSLCPR